MLVDRVFGPIHLAFQSQEAPFGHQMLSQCETGARKKKKKDSLAAKVLSLAAGHPMSK